MVLKTYYEFSNPGSYGGLGRLRKATGVPLKKLKTIMRKNLIYTLHKLVRRRYTKNPTVANSIDHEWAADLADMKNLSRHNKGVKYLLMAVDVLSESILKEGRKPLRLQTDKGREFYKTFQEYLKQKNINHKSFCSRKI